MNDSFRQCIFDLCGAEVSALTGGCKYTVFDGNVAVVEGHGGIADFSREKITFVLGKEFLEVSGQNLRLKCLEKHFAVILGKIVSVGIGNG